MSDATVLLRDIAGDAAQNAATRVNPSQDELSQIDRPADDNTWHDVPDMSRDKLRNQVKGQYEKQKPFSRAEMRDAAGDATQTAHPGGSRDPGHAADLAARDQRQGIDSGVDAQSGARAGMQNLQDKASANMPEETKDRARNITGQTKGYLSEKIPQERREQTIYRLKKMIVEIQGHQDCKPSASHFTMTGLTTNRPASNRDFVELGRELRRPCSEPYPADRGNCEGCSQRYCTDSGRG